MRRASFVAGAAGLLLMAAAAEAVKPGAWVFSTEKDFEKGKFEGTVVDSHGQLTLGREMKPVDTGKDAEMVAGIAQGGDGAIYVGMNPDGKIYRIEAGKSTLVYSAPKEFSEVTAIGVDGKGNLLVALSGDKARLVRLTVKGKEKAQAATAFESDHVDYIWAIATAPDGTVYLGTGPEGKVYKLGEDGGAGKVVLESPAKNVTALAFDKQGNLVAGTDEKGLVIRVDAKTGQGFVLLDAGKVDVNAIVVDKAGAIYVGTAKPQDEDDKNSNPEEPETKSKPAMPEPERVEPPPEDKKGAKGHMNLPAGFGMLAANEQTLPADVKKLLAQALADKGKQGPSTRKKPGLPTPASESRGKASGAAPHPSASQDEEEPSDSSAVYRISPDGAATTLIDDGDMNYSLALVGDDLLIGTGNAGKLFRYRMADQTVALLARLKEEHITALLAAKSGDVFVGTANMGQVYQLGSGIAKSGTFTSQVLDAGHSADWGRALIDAQLPAGTKATLATRSGNTRSVEDGNDKFWSDWSQEIDGAAGEKVASPGARYVQFRVTLTSGGGDGKESGGPEVDRVRVGYQTRNLPPRIKNVLVSAGGGGSEGDDEDDSPDRSGDADTPPKVAQVAWEATDPNGDTLVYRLFYRQVAAGKEDVWTPLARDLKALVYEWDTRSLADGKYQVKVIASDKPDNATEDAKETARVSAPFTIDRTPPTLSDLKADAQGNKATLSGAADDATSAVVDVRYQVDNQGDWQPAAASDKMFDSAHEPFTIVTGLLSAGAHRITVRASDAQGNCSYKTATVVVRK